MTKFNRMTKKEREVVKRIAAVMVAAGMEGKHYFLRNNPFDWYGNNEGTSFVVIINDHMSDPFTWNDENRIMPRAFPCSWQGIDNLMHYLHLVG